MHFMNYTWQNGKWYACIMWQNKIVTTCMFSGNLSYLQIYFELLSVFFTWSGPYLQGWHEICLMASQMHIPVCTMVLLTCWDKRLICLIMTRSLSVCMFMTNAWVNTFSFDIFICPGPFLDRSGLSMSCIKNCSLQHVIEAWSW